MENNRKRPALAAAIILFLIGVVCPLLYVYVDIPAAEYARNQLPRSFVDAVNKTTNLDDYINYTCVVIGLYALLRLKNKARFQMFIFPPLASLSAGILTHLVKWPVGRWRPKALFKHDMYGFEFLGPIKAGLHQHFGVHSAFCDAYPFARSGLLISFPSGHTSSMMGIMTAIAILKPKYRWPCFVVAVLFGSARVIEGAHFPSDVIGGLIAGYLGAHLLRRILLRKNWLPAPPSEL